MRQRSLGKRKSLFACVFRANYADGGWKNGKREQKLNKQFAGARKFQNNRRKPERETNSLDWLCYKLH